jgi:hypothetical protein
MEHLSIFTLGTGFGLLVAFLTGFSKQAGADFYAFLKSKIFPPELEPIEVARSFEPDSSGCSWVGEDKLTSCVAQGYSYYKHGESNAKCYRYSSSARNHKEFLMHRPDEN